MLAGEEDNGGEEAAGGRPLLRLFPVLLLNLVAFGVAIPILPPLVLALGGTATDVGLIFALQATGQFLAAPWWGQTSDRHGRRPVLLLTIAGAALVDGLTAGCGALWMLYLARLCAGLFAGNVAAASALIADATDRSNRSKGMALIGICFGLGFTIGPALGGMISYLAEKQGQAIAAMGGPLAWLADLGALDSRLPFAAAALLNLSCVLLGFWLLREARQRQLRQAYRPRRRLLVTLRRRPVVVMCGLYLVYTVSSTILEATFFLYMAKQHGFDQARVGLIFAALGLLMAGIQGGVGRISGRLGDRRMTGLGVLLMALGLALAPAGDGLGRPGWSLALLLGLLAVSTVGRALLQPGAMGMTSNLARDERENGQLMGILQSSSSLGRVGGPALGGALFEWVSPSAPFVVAGVLLGVWGLGWWAATGRGEGFAAARARPPWQEEGE